MSHTICIIWCDFKPTVQVRSTEKVYAGEPYHKCKSERSSEWNVASSARNFFKRSFMEQEKKEEQSNVLAHYKKQNCIFEDIMQKIKSKCSCFSHEFSQFQNYRIDQVGEKLSLWNSQDFFIIFFRDSKI